MFISHKNNTIQTIQETEWECRRISKGLTMPEYWAWIETITSDDDPPVVTYPSEDFTIVECTDEDVPARLVQLGDYFHNSLETGKTYNIKYYASKRDSEIVDVEAHKDEDGKDVAATYIQSHFIKDDTAKDKRILDAEWANIRTERDRLLAESDWTQANDTPLSDADVAKWKTYRTSLRDLPSDQSSKTKYSDITWPTKP